VLVRFAKQNEVRQIFESVETVSWAPWLAASSELIRKRIQNFPDGQLLAEESGKIAGYLSLNRISLDASGQWPEWFGVVGAYEDFGNFDLKGNTLFLVSMGVALEYRGSGVTSLLIKHAKDLAKKSNLGLASCFRPSGFGQYKFEHKELIPMSEYVKLKDNFGQPIDPWLRSLAKNGARFLGVKNDYYKKIIPTSEFEIYKKNYKKDYWWNKDGVWECMEAGSFVKNEDGGYTYLESNVCGLID